MARFAVLALVVASLAACTTTTADEPSRDLTVRPTSSVPATFDVRDVALPEGVEAAQGLAIAAAEGRKLLGTKKGLYALGSDGRFDRIDEREIRALAFVPKLGFLVATTTGIEVFDGAALRPSMLEDVVDPSKIRAFATRGEDLVILVDDGVLVVREGRLTALRGFGEVVGVATHADGPIVLRRAKGGVILELEGTAWRSQEIEQELLFLVPASGGRVLGVTEVGRGLVERTRREGRAFYHDVALAMGELAAPARDVEALAGDPGSGAVWIVAADALMSVRDGVVYTGARPDLAGALLFPTTDGSLYAAKGTRLVEVALGRSRISWQASLLPLHQMHCERCHRAGGVATFKLDTASDWRAGRDAILSAITTGRMPRDRATVVTAAELDVVRSWANGGAED